ncbi:MAG: hypothetical protein H0V04_07765 [Chloroflexi bacterium]|nr:hypothetical protein [Chloroflexota bacterium]
MDVSPDAAGAPLEGAPLEGAPLVAGIDGAPEGAPLVAGIDGAPEGARVGVPPPGVHAATTNMAAADIALRFRNFIWSEILLAPPRAAPAELAGDTASTSFVSA